jgi:nitrate/TMAO reductase-like tetraheme cytochrome c subunit
MPAMKLRNLSLAGLALGLSAVGAQLLPRTEETAELRASAWAGARAAGEQRVTNSAALVVPPHRPAGHAPRVATGVSDRAGRPVSVACMTCHATREPDRAHGVGGTVPDDFHQGLRYAHAGQSCLSCHHSADYDSLRAADGRSVPFAQAQQLCAQCHGPQTRDYLAGSHGGMTGHWDKAAGSRERNTCTDCHDPHAPAYPLWTPVFAPVDAAARQQAAREAQHSETSKKSAHE